MYKVWSTHTAALFYRRQIQFTICKYFLLCYVLPYRGVASNQILGGPYLGKKSLICLEAKSMTPCQVHISFPFLPATPSPRSQTLKGLFELSRHPSRALDSPCALHPELHSYMDTVRCALLWRSLDTILKTSKTRFYKLPAAAKVFLGHK